MSLPLEVSTPEIEGQYQVSQFRKLSLLLNGDEMERLIASLGAIRLFIGSAPVKRGEEEIPLNEFCTAYRTYAEGLERGALIDETALRPYFSAMMTKDSAKLYAFPVAGDRFLIRPKQPIIQLQRHHFVRGSAFHSGVMGKDSVTWGITISYPHLSIDPKTKEIVKLPRDETFEQVVKWVRNFTRPTPIWERGEKINLPIRLGLQCFSWIDSHVDLVKNGLTVNGNSS